MSMFHFGKTAEGEVNYLRMRDIEKRLSALESVVKELQSQVTRLSFKSALLPKQKNVLDGSQQ